jgi:hypothetical protein
MEQQDDAEKRRCGETARKAKINRRPPPTAADILSDRINPGTILRTYGAGRMFRMKA